MKQNRFLIVILLSTMLFACRNSYEKKVVGKYRIADYKPDSVRIDDVLLMDLRKDNTFIVIINQTRKSGTWEAGDDGDRTWIRFNFVGGKASDGQVVGTNLEIISIWNPADFSLPDLKELSLYRFE